MAETTVTEQKIQKLLAEYKERTKELAAINQTNAILKQGKPIEDTLQEIVFILPQAWQYPKHTAARIQYDGKEFVSPNFQETKWSQVQLFEPINGKKGSIEVYYLKHFPLAEEGPFLKEERDLIDNLATLITGYLNGVNADMQSYTENLNGETQLPDEQNNKTSAVINETSDLIQSESTSVDETLQQIVSNMPRAWQYPEHAVARIQFDGKEYLSSNIKLEDNVKWVQSQDFETIDKKRGVIELLYLKDFPIKDEGPYLESERLLLNNISNLVSEFLNIIKVREKKSPQKQQIIKLVAENKERLKELTCINQATKILREGKDIGDTLKQICYILPKAWQYPEYTVARIKFDGNEYTSPGFKETKWIQKQPFLTLDKKRGAIDVFYTKEFPKLDEGPFLREERTLINHLASLLSGYLDIVRGINEVSNTKQSMKQLISENTERLKELTCINQTSDIIKDGQPIGETLKRICKILPQAWQFPTFTVARITYPGYEFSSPEGFDSKSFEKTPWQQTQTFKTFDGKEGKIEIFYLQEFPEADEGPFLKEERSLIQNLANLITGYINSIKGEDIIKEYQKAQVNKIKQKQKRHEALDSKQLLQNFMNRYNYDRDIYHDLMPFKVKEILLIANLYDAYSIEKEGRFSEHILGQYHQLNLTSLPRITGASTYKEAVAQLRTKHFDLIILMMGVDKNMPIELSRKIKADFSYIPIFLLLNNDKDIHIFEEPTKRKNIDKIYVWNGDSRIFFGMVKHLEDMVNVDNDTKVGMSRVILLVEDSAKYYSRYLPLFYTSVMEQTKRIIDDVSTDELYKVLRLRVRPKILLASDYEEAIDLFYRYKDYLLCLITDVKFKRNGEMDSNAGFRLVKHIKKQIKDLPTLVQSSNMANKKKAQELQSSFINKNSESLVQDVKNFISYNLGFGNFVYKDEKGNQIDVARSLKEFEDKLSTIPDESLLYHAKRNHFSLWLMARGEIELAQIIHPYQITDFKSAQDLREHLIDMIKRYKHEKNKGKVVDFSEYAIGSETNIPTLASGSLGGKGRGLAFVNTLLYNFDFAKHVPNIKIKAPRTAIIGTDEFDHFLDANNLHEKVYKEKDTGKIRKMFLQASLSEELQERLKVFLNLIKKPLAIRSSGLFEDSLMQPFAGIFATYLLPNNSENFEVRFNQMMNAIKLVYASVFSAVSRGYIRAINYKIEQEKMAVIIQEAVGNQYENKNGKKYFYPHISGTAQSHNYYPVAHMKPEEGFAVAAVGLGQYVVEGEKAYRFSPSYPTIEINTPKDQLKSTQTYFYAIDMNKKSVCFLDDDEIASLAKLEIFDAEKHGTLKHCASTFDPDNDTISPGLGSYGPRVINFANILKYEYIPLAKTINIILDVVKEALGSPVEIEYAVDLNKDENNLATFYLLQIKPLVGNMQDYNINLSEINTKRTILYTQNSMGNGTIDNITDVIYVDKSSFDKTKTIRIAEELDMINEKMCDENRKYVLIGPGRWGTRDRFIGIPVAWPQISNAKIIVEVGLEDFPLDASLGSHFFHNVTSMNVGYFSVQSTSDRAYIKWDKLENQKLIEQTEFVKHVRFEKPLEIKMDGKKQIAVIMM